MLSLLLSWPMSAASMVDLEFLAVDGSLAQVTGEISGPLQPANKFDTEFVWVPGDYFFGLKGCPIVTSKCRTL